MALPRSALHVITGMDVKYGGPTLCMPALAIATTKTGRYQNQVLDFASHREDSLYIERDNLPYTPMPRSLLQLTFNVNVRRSLRELLQDTDVIQTTGLWKGPN